MSVMPSDGREEAKDSELSFGRQGRPAEERAFRKSSRGVRSAVPFGKRLIRARDNQIAALYNHNLARLELASATGNIQEYVNQ